MIHINKNLLLFLTIIAFLGVFVLLFLQKLISFATHTNYYCQSLVNSFSLPISHSLGTLFFSLLFLFSAIPTTKLVIILVKAHLLKTRLIKKSRTNRSFTTLLQKLKIKDSTYLIESSDRFAFCLGIRNPKIYISTKLVALLNTQELEAVLRHERYHLEKRDTLTMLIASVGESLLPFFPLLSDVLRNYRVEREIKADQEAIEGLGSHKPLITALKKLLGTPSVARASFAAIADEDTLEPRILMLMKNEKHVKRFRLKHILISIFSLGIMSAFVLSPVQAVEVHHDGQGVIMFCQQGKTCLNACTQQDTVGKNYSEEVLYSTLK